MKSLYWDVEMNSFFEIFLSSSARELSEALGSMKFMTR